MKSDSKEEYNQNKVYNWNKKKENECEHVPEKEKNLPTKDTQYIRPNFHGGRPVPYKNGRRTYEPAKVPEYVNMGPNIRAPRTTWWQPRPSYPHESPNWGYNSRRYPHGETIQTNNTLLDDNIP